MNSNYYIKTPENGYWLKAEAIKKVEDMYKAKYMGPWCLKTIEGLWSETPCDIFYVANPDKSKGHTNYFGLHYRNNGALYITNGESAFSEPIYGVITDDGEVIVSRYRHDYVVKGDFMVDGGRDYTRVSGGNLIEVTVNSGEFNFNSSAGNK